MFTYRVRARTFRTDDPSATLTFPADVVISLHLLPGQPFGVESGGGRTAVQAKPASATFDANSGRHWVESVEPLSALDVTFEEPSRVVALRGRVFSVSRRVQTRDDLGALIDSLFFMIPALLAIDFADPPHVERVSCVINGVSCRWELLDWKARFDITTQFDQEGHVLDAWERVAVVSQPGHLRLLAAVHYLHAAKRLLAVGATAGEFLAEALLNFSKVLEVLFPSSSQMGSIDAARRGLKALGYTDAQSDARFTPAIVMRNRIDVGHVDLTFFTLEQITVLHEYAEAAEGHFSELLSRVFAGVKSGAFQVVPAEHSKPGPAEVGIIDRLAKAMATDAAA